MTKPLFPHDEIKKMIDSQKVVIFGKGEKEAPECGFTMKVQGIFNFLEEDYGMFNILTNEPLWQEMWAYSDWPTFPQVYVNGEFIGGCDIVVEMYESGELKKMLEK